MRYTFLLPALFWLTQACKSKQHDAGVHHIISEDAVTLTEDQIKNAGIETAVIEKHRLNSELKVHGLVDVPPQNIVSISFPLGGYLKNTRLLPGMHVTKGEVIATIEDQALIQLQQDYLIAKAKLEFTEKDFERQKTLNENKVNADKIYQQAQSEYTAQKVLVKGYDEKLRLIGINPEKLNENNISRSVPMYSPINGFVSKVNVNIGKFVNAADVLFELINPDDIHAVLTVFEKDLTKVKPRQQVLITFVDDPASEYEAEVLLVTKNVDDNRSALVHCHFENQPRQLLPGMFLNARIKLSDHEVTAVPEAALVRYGNDEFLLEHTDNKSFHLLPVQSGIKENGLVEVSGKNNEELSGKTIIIKNAYAILSQIKNAGEED